MSKLYLLILTEDTEMFYLKKPKSVYDNFIKSGYVPAG